MTRFLLLFGLCLSLVIGCNKDSDNPVNNNEQVREGITVHINSTPSGANIDMDGGATGKFTPHTFTNLSVGTHRFRIYKDDNYNQLDTALNLAADDERTITASVASLWDRAWSGLHFLSIDDKTDYYNPQWSPFDSLRLPKGLANSVTIEFIDERCWADTAIHDGTLFPLWLGFYTKRGFREYEITGSPMRLSIDTSLGGQKGTLKIVYQTNGRSSPCDKDGITITNFKLESH